MEEKVQVQEATELKKQSQGLETVVYNLKVDDAQSCSRADKLVKDCLELEKQIKEFFAPSKKTAHDLHKKIIDMEKKQLDPIGKMKGKLKQDMSAYIREEEQYNDAIHTLNLALALAESIEDNILEEDAKEFTLWKEAIQRNMKLIRTEVDTKEFKEIADRAYRAIDAFRQDLIFEIEEDIPEPEVKKSKTNLRKLSLKHEIQVESMKKLVDAVAFGEVPIDWITVNESAIRRDVKEFETEEAFKKKYPSAGVKVKITKELR